MRLAYISLLATIFLLGSAAAARAHPPYERLLATSRGDGEMLYYFTCHVDGVSTFDQVYPFARTTPRGDAPCDKAEVESAKGYYDIVAECSDDTCALFGFESAIHTAAERVVVDRSGARATVPIAWPRGLAIHLEARWRSYATTSLAGALLWLILLVTRGRARLRLLATGSTACCIVLLFFAAHLIVLAAVAALGAGALVASGAWLIRIRLHRARSDRSSTPG